MNRIVEWLIRRKARLELERWLEQVLKRPLTRKENSMLKGLFVNWQTTLIGIVMGAIQLHQGGMTWGNAAIAALMAALGIVAKDHNVTGGTTAQ